MIGTKHTESLLFASFGFICANKNRVNADVCIAAALIIVMSAHRYDVPLVRSFDLLYMSTYISTIHASDYSAVEWPAFPALVNPMLFPAAAFTSVIACTVDIMNFNAHNDFFLAFAL